MELGQEIYLDNNATTKIEPEVLKNMQQYYNTRYGNASCSYSLGHASKYALDVSRNKIGSYLKIDSEKIYFTSGATESNNWVILNTINKYIKPIIIVSAIEHPSVFETVHHYYKKGLCEYHVIPVDSNGIVDLNKLAEVVQASEDIKLCSIMAVNNEIGSIQPIDDIVSLLKGYNIQLHVDATQAIGKLNIDYSDVDFVTASAHKIHGPKGVGMLYCKHHISPILIGGGQESEKRAGTENIPGIVGFADALSLMDSYITYMSPILEDFKQQINNKLIYIEKTYGIETYTNTILNKNYSVSNTFNFSFLDSKLPKLLLDYMNSRNIFISAGSACSSGIPLPSRTVLHMTRDTTRAKNTIRISMSKHTYQKEITTFLNELENFCILTKEKELN